jgi:hypothetical protein
MDIDNLESPSGDDAYYDENFRVILESHLTYLRNLSTTKTLTFDSFLSYKHQGDLFGLLDELNIAKQYHYIIMRINDFRCPGDLTDKVVSLLIPDLGEVALLKATFMTSH